MSHLDIYTPLISRFFFKTFNDRYRDKLFREIAGKQKIKCDIPKVLVLHIGHTYDVRSRLLCISRAFRYLTAIVRHAANAANAIFYPRCTWLLFCHLSILNILDRSFWYRAFSSLLFFLFSSTTYVVKNKEYRLFNVVTSLFHLFFD